MDRGACYNFSLEQTNILVFLISVQIQLRHRKGDIKPSPSFECLVFETLCVCLCILSVCVFFPICVFVCVYVPGKA